MQFYRILKILILLPTFLSCATLTAQNNTDKHLIEGHVTLDSIWEPKLYLSYISDFSKMYTMSNSMIIAESEVDASGYFKFNIDFLPKENSLYRIHISKRGTSKVSIIIGGNDENHFFLVANNKSYIKIENQSRIFSNVTFHEDEKNKILDKVDDIVKLMDSTNFSAPRVKSEFVTNAFNEQLRHIADTCSYALVSLYTLQRSKYESDLKNNLEFYQNYSDKWKTESSAYFEKFRAKIPERNSAIDYRLFMALSVGAAYLLGYFIGKRNSEKKPSDKRSIDALSIQERRIYSLLVEGKSNKEISEEFNIGVSTVKSHVSSIYNKLNVKSRKEIVDL